MNIEIINETPLLQPVVWPIKILFVLLVIIMTIIMLYYYKTGKFYRSVKTLLVTALTGILIMCILGGVLYSFGHKRVGTRYTVVIPEDVTLEEFLKFSENYTNVYKSNDVWYFDDLIE